MYIADQFVSNKGKYDRKKLNADLGQAKYNEENIEDKNKDEKTNIYDVLNSLKHSSLDEAVYIQEGKIIFIRSKFNSSQLKVLNKLGKEIDEKPRITDITSQRDFTSITVSADITNSDEVEKYIYILNNGEKIETTESSQTFEGLEPATKYTVTIKAVLSDGTVIEMLKEISTLDNTPPIEPIINSSYGYPLLTEYGVVDGGKTTIIYDVSEDAVNEYSLDGGVTWNEYKGSFNINETCTIMAKSVKPNGLESGITKEIIMPKDVLGGDAFDDDESTSFRIPNATRGKYIYIDETAIGKKLKIITDGQIWMYVIDKDGNETLTKQIEGYVIPENTVKIEIYNPESVGRYIYEIGINTKTESEVDLVYATIYEDRIEESYYNISYKYYSTASQRLYKIDDGEWQEYKNNKIKLAIGKTIYEKSIDSNGKVLSETSYKAEVANSTLAMEALDNDETTSFRIPNATRGKYINIDETAIGKKLKIITDGQIWMYVIDKDGNETLTKQIEDYVIPENTVKIEIYNPESVGRYIYEIGIKN